MPSGMMQAKAITMLISNLYKIDLVYKLLTQLCIEDEVTILPLVRLSNTSAK